MNLTRKTRRRLAILLVVYLVLDLRPLLLLPNVFLYYASPSDFVDDEKHFRLRVFPKLNVGSDPVVAVLSLRNVSDHDVVATSLFSRDYDRAGIYYELQMSGRVNSKTDIEPLTWLYGGGGGLSKRTHISAGEVLRKFLRLNDYIDLERSGLYAIDLGVSDEKGGTYDLEGFSVLRLPENYLSRALRQSVLAIALLLPSESLRDIVARRLGFDADRFSTWALAKYYFGNCDDWVAAKYSTAFENIDSLARARKGITRYQNTRVVSRTVRAYERDHSQAASDLLRTYLGAHWRRMVYWPALDESDALTHLRLLVQQTYPYMDGKAQDEFSGSLPRHRRVHTDAYHLEEIDKYDRRIEKTSREDTKANAKRNRAYHMGEYNKREDRERKVRLIDAVSAAVNELDLPP